MISWIISHSIAAVLGAVAGIFIYRNNEKDIDPIADKVDEIHDEVKEKVKKK